MYTLENWSVCSSRKGCNRFTPADAKGFAIRAKSSDRPGFQDGLITTRVTQVTGRVITTQTGTVYQLGTPDPNYVSWCRDKGMHDPGNEEELVKIYQV